MVPLWPFSWSFQRPHHVHVSTSRVSLCVSAASLVLSHQLSVEGTLQGSSQTHKISSQPWLCLAWASLPLLQSCLGRALNLCLWPDVPDMVSLYTVAVTSSYLALLLSLSQHLCRIISSSPLWSVFASSVVSPTPYTTMSSCTVSSPSNLSNAWWSDLWHHAYSKWESFPAVSSVWHVKGS